MRLLLTLLLAVPGILCAQPSGKRTCRVLFLDAPDSAPNKLFLFDGASSQEIELPRLNLSKVYDLPGGPLRLRLLAAPLADPKLVPADAPSAEVAETVGDIYLILGHDPANTTAPARMQVVDASSSKLRPGHMLWYNITPHEVGGIIGSSKLALKPNSRVILDPPAAESTDYDVKLAYRIAGEKDYDPICETKWLHDPRSRAVVFVLGGPAGRTPRVMMFTDYREPAGKDKKGTP